MVPFAPRHPAPGLRKALSSATLVLALAASGGGCTLLVGGELSDKPSEGAGGAGGGGGAASATSHSSSTAPSGATGGLMCAPDTANCDGDTLNGCETKLETDPRNCGSCKNVCQNGDHCKDSKCD